MKSAAPWLDESLRKHLQGLRGMFYAKSDIALPDALLRELRSATPGHSGVHEATVSAVLEHIGKTPREIRAVDQQGTFHVVFLARCAGENLAVRFNRCSHHFVDWQMYADQQVSEHLALRGLSHAKVLVVDVTRSLIPADWCVMEQVMGQTLTDLDQDDVAMAAALDHLARFLRQVHAIEGDGYGFLDVSDPPDPALAGPRPLRGTQSTWKAYVMQNLGAHVQAVLAAHLVTADEASQIHDLFGSFPGWDNRQPGRLLHGDPGNHNVHLDQSGSITMIDWEDALLGDPVFELAFWASFHPERRWSQFFGTYFGKAWSPTPDFWLYYLRIALSKTVHRLRFGLADRPDRPKASLRIQRALAGLAEAPRHEVLPLT